MLANYGGSVAIISGLLSSLSFAPYRFWWLQIICLAVLITLIRAHARTRAAFYGFLYAFAFYIAGHFWLFELVPSFHAAPWILGVFILCLVSIMLAGLAALAIYAYKLLNSDGVISGGLLLAGLWLCADSIRTHIWGFPWLKLGYTQTDSVLAGLAPLGGVDLVTAALIITAYALVSLIRSVISSRPLPIRQSPYALMVIAVVMVFAISGKLVHWSRPAGKELSVTLVQLNLGMDTKWNLAARDRIFNDYLRTSSEAYPQSLGSLHMLVLPENAFPVPLHAINDQYWSRLKANSDMLVAGVTEYRRPDDEHSVISNATMVQCGNTRSLYRKRELVPFGEKRPLERWFDDLYELIGVTTANYISSPDSGTVSCDGITMAFAICFEIMFPQTRWGNYDILLNTNEEGWFHRTRAPDQRIQYAQMRALEHARPVVSVANNGPSLLIDHTGAVIDSTRRAERIVLDAQVELRTGITPYMRYGNWVGIFSLLWIAVMTLRSLVRSTIKSEVP